MATHSGPHNNFIVIKSSSNLILNLIVELEVELAIYATTAAGAYRVVSLCAQLTRDLLAIAKFLVLKAMQKWGVIQCRPTYSTSTVI